MTDKIYDEYDQQDREYQCGDHSRNVKAHADSAAHSGTTSELVSVHATVDSVAGNNVCQCVIH